MSRAVILFGHGSRDAQWRAPMDAVAARMQALESHVPVRCAFLELQRPDLASAAGELVELGATHIVVVPLFLGIGRHAREDLPRLAGEVRAAHPHLHLELRPPVGEDPRMVQLLAELALAPSSSADPDRPPFAEQPRPDRPD